MGKERQRTLGRGLGEFGFSFLSVEAVLSASDKALATTLYVERRELLRSAINGVASK